MNKFFIIITMILLPIVGQATCKTFAEKTIIAIKTLGCEDCDYTNSRVKATLIKSTKWMEEFDILYKDQDGDAKVLYSMKVLNVGGHCNLRALEVKLED